MSTIEIGWRVLRGAAVAYVVIVALAFVFQRKLLYFPDTERRSPAAEGLKGVDEVVLETPDGHSIFAWWLPPKPGKPVVLYFHGNGGNVSYRQGRVLTLQGAGMGALMMTYRGFGGSTGSPSESAIMADAKLAYDWLAKRGFTGERIALFGESLGSGVAVQLAAERPVAGIVLDSPFSSTADVAAQRLPFLPVRWLLLDQFNSMAHIGRVKAPLLVVHGDRDEIVPYDLGRRLYEAANEPKRFVTLAGAGHTVPWREGAWAAVRAFLEGLPAQRR